MKLFYKTALAKILFNRRKNQIIRNQPNYAIKTFAYESSFDNNGNYIDKFFGDLPEYLKVKGHRVVSLVGCIGNYKNILIK